MKPAPRKPWTEFAIQTVPQAFPVWYDRLAVQVFTPIHRALAERVARHRPTTVLDHGTGTARAAIQIARVVPDATVTGLDVSDHLRMQAEQNVRGEDLEQRIHLPLMESATGPLPGRTHDVAVAAFVMHCQPDLPTFLFPCVRAGGRLSIVELRGDVAWPVTAIADEFARLRLAPEWLPRTLLRSAVRRACQQLPTVDEMDRAIHQSPFGRVATEEAWDLVIGNTRVADAVRWMELHAPEVVSHPA